LKVKGFKMTKSSNIARKINVGESRQEADTFKLWESYREQATMWRVIALFQMFGSFLLICFAFYLYSTREITLHVPRQPLPGQYAVNQVPEDILVEAATEIVNLIATYQPHTAEKQFRAVLELLDEPALSQFKETMLGMELQAIRGTSRTQLFVVDPSRNTIEFSRHGAHVTLIGERDKFMAGKLLTPVTTAYRITFTTKPRNKINPYGLVATKIEQMELKNGIR
jgi:hypothetical protein